MSENKKRILLIEDDIFLRELCLMKLEAAQYEVDEASDGEIGLEKLLHNSYDLVLLDIMLSKLSGFEVLDQFQKRKPVSKPSPIIVIMSNLSEQSQINRALQMGAKDYIVKAHYSPTEIVTKISQLLS